MAGSPLLRSPQQGEGRHPLGFISEETPSPRKGGHCARFHEGGWQDKHLERHLLTLSPVSLPRWEDVGMKEDCRHGSKQDTVPTL